MQALLHVASDSQLPAARKSALRALSRLVRDRRVAAVLMAVEGHKVSVFGRKGVGGACVCVCARACVCLSIVCVYVCVHVCVCTCVRVFVSIVCD